MAQGGDLPGTSGPKNSYNVFLSVKTTLAPIKTRSYSAGVI